MAMAKGEDGRQAAVKGAGGGGSPKVTHVRLSTEQQNLAEYDTGSLAVEAAPGAGKTSVIVGRLEHLLGPCGVRPEEILVLTFSRRAVRELRGRVALALPEVGGQLEVRTFHGFASRLLAIEHPGFTSGRLIERPAGELVLQEAFLRTTPHGFAPSVIRSPAFARDAERYLTDLQRAGATVCGALKNGGSARLGDLIAVAESLSELRRTLGVADYDDLVARAVALAGSTSSRVYGWLQGRYRHVLVDEFQDTDTQQVMLLQALRSKVFAVGDAAQAIYGFRGAARNAIVNAIRALDMQPRRLGSSQRCPQAVCDLVNAIPGLPLEQHITTNVSHNGEVAVLLAASPLDEASLVADRVVAAREAGVPSAQIAVLLRSLNPLGAFIRSEIERRGIRASLTGGDAIMQEPIVRVLIDALRAIADPTDIDRWINLFAAPALGYPRLRLYRDLHLHRPSDLTSAIALLRKNPGGRLTPEAIEKTFVEAQAAWDIGDVDKAAHCVARGLDLLGAVLAEGDASAQRAGRRLGRMLDALEDIVRTRRQLGAVNDPSAVLAALEEHAAQWSDDAEESDDAEVVRVLTIHAAKGLEFDTVILADAADGRLPVHLRREGIVEEGDVNLARSLGCDLGATPQEHLEEERSLYYVAATRSKRTLVITYSCRSLDGTPNSPSRFLPVAERDRLVGLEPYRAPLVYDGIAKVPAAIEPRSITLPAPIGVTKVDDWFSCQRKFFYSAVLRLPSERAFQMTFGILVHKVLEEFHREHQRVDARVDKAAWIHEVRGIRARVWQDAQFDWDLERKAAGASADRMLGSYVDTMAAEGAKRPFTVEAVERRIEFDQDGVSLVGKLDRIDRFDDGSKRIVDYKTGRLYNELEKGLGKLVEGVLEDNLYAENSPRLASVQLPLYRRALQASPDLALVYLRGTDGGSVAIDGLKSGEATSLLDAVDNAVREGFSELVSRGTLMQRTTADLRTCQNCNFYSICDGSLEAVDVEV